MLHIYVLLSWFVVMLIRIMYQAFKRSTFLPIISIFNNCISHISNKNARIHRLLIWFDAHFCQLKQYSILKTWHSECFGWYLTNTRMGLIEMWRSNRRFLGWWEPALLSSPSHYVPAKWLWGGKGLGRVWGRGYQAESERRWCKAALFSLVPTSTARAFYIYRSISRLT